MIQTEDARARVALLLRQYGYQSQSYNVLLPDKSYFFPEGDSQSVIAYVVRAGVALGAGDPIGDPSRFPIVITEFREFCRGRGWRCCFQSVTERCEEALQGLGFGSMKIGEEPIFQLQGLSWAGGRFKDLRRDMRRAMKQGLAVVEYRPLERRRIEWDGEMVELSQSWARFKGSGEFSFLIGKPSINDPGERKYFVAIREDHIEAFVVCTPVHARNGVYFDLMRRREKPLSGTAQFLIAESFRLLGEQGYEMATLGTAPLANEHVEDHDQSRFIALAMEVTFNYLGYFHRYKPLYQFKEQFGPSSWEARYLAYWPPRFHPGILYALLKAYDPTGVSGKARRQLRLVWQGIRWLGQTPKELLDKIIQR